MMGRRLRKTNAMSQRAGKDGRRVSGGDRGSVAAESQSNESRLGGRAGRVSERRREMSGGVCTLRVGNEYGRGIANAG
jgi:hypothetical protein